MVHGVELINGGFGMKNPIIAHAQDQRILTSSINPSKLINSIQFNQSVRKDSLNLNRSKYINHFSNKHCIGTGHILYNTKRNAFVYESFSLIVLFISGRRTELHMQYMQQIFPTSTVAESSSEMSQRNQEILVYDMWEGFQRYIRSQTTHTNPYR